jgi:hypothetical protein
MAGDAVPAAGDLPQLILDAHRDTIRLRDETLASAARTIDAGIRCGGLLDRARGKLTENEWDTWLSEHTPEVEPEQARRYQLVARRAREAAELTNGTVRQLYMDLGLLPPSDYQPPEPGAEPRPIDWSKWTVKIDAQLSIMSREQKERLRMWCQSTLRRLA